MTKDSYSESSTRKLLQNSEWLKRRKKILKNRKKPVAGRISSAYRAWKKKEKEMNKNENVFSQNSNN